MKLLIGICTAALVTLLLLVTIQPAGGQAAPKHVQPVSWEQTAGPSSNYCIGFVCYHTEWACDANYACWQVQWTYFRGKWV